ncbi:MAG: lasso peptide biosynthesis B2 protein [Chloroflexota bacterium]
MQKWLRLLKRSPQLLRKQTLADWLLLFEALPILMISRLLVLLLPFRYTASLLGEVSREGAESTLKEPEQIERIGVILRWLSRYLPWRSMCFEQALAGMLMLKRRGLDGTIYFGVQKGPEQMKAHAWLRCGNQIITGAAGRERFTVLFTVAS